MNVLTVHIPTLPDISWHYVSKTLGLFWCDDCVYNHLVNLLDILDVDPPTNYKIVCDCCGKIISEGVNHE